MAPPSHEQGLHHDVLRLFVAVQTLIEVRALARERRQRRRVEADGETRATTFGARLETAAEAGLEPRVVGAEEHPGAMPSRTLHHDSQQQVLVAQQEVRCRFDGLVAATDVNSQPLVSATKQGAYHTLQPLREGLPQGHVPPHEGAALGGLRRRNAAEALNRPAVRAEGDLVLVGLHEPALAQRLQQHRGRTDQHCGLLEEGVPQVGLARGTLVEELVPGPIDDQRPSFLLARQRVAQGQREHREQAVGVLAPPHQDRRRHHALREAPWDGEEEVLQGTGGHERRHCGRGNR
mmetsp:Transcript_31860/g.82029  ORF Transcript_31860/g.82029 Transcript_31860/m.82029 type:complete len:292 (+) Transcript_31860:376-1251(+)